MTNHDIHPPSAAPRAERTGRARVRRFGWSALGVMLTAQLLLPFFPQGGQARVHLADVTVLAMATGATCFAALRWSWPRALVAALVVSTITFGVEFAGVTTGLPFGAYEYTGRLQPSLGSVPLLVPFAWLGMGLASYAAGAALVGTRAGTTGRLARIALGAVALTAWDLFLDPQMVGEGYWTWTEGGAYRGIPASNFAGWLATSVAVMLLLEVILPWRPGDATAVVPGTSTRAGTNSRLLRGVRAASERPLLTLYAWMAAGSTFAFAVFFRDPLVTVAGGLVMGTLAVAAWRRALRTS